MKYFLLILFVSLSYAADLPKLNLFSSGDSLWLMVDLPEGSEITASVIDDESSIPCEVITKGGEGWDFEKWIFPSPQQVYYKELDYTKSVFNKDFIIKSKVNSFGKSGHLEFKFQSCKGGLCLPPQSIEIKLPES